MGQQPKLDKGNDLHQILVTCFELFRIMIIIHLTCDAVLSTQYKNNIIISDLEQYLALQIARFGIKNTRKIIENF